MSEFIGQYAVTMAIIWGVSFVLTVLHSAFNEDEFTVRDLFFAVFFGPLYTLIRYSDWNTALIKWPKRKTKT